MNVGFFMSGFMTGTILSGTIAYHVTGIGSRIIDHTIEPLTNQAAKGTACMAFMEMIPEALKQPELQKEAHRNMQKVLIKKSGLYDDAPVQNDKTA